METIISKFLTKKRNEERKTQLHNKNFTLLSSNCTAGVIYHDLGLKFISPTINLWFSPNDYIKFLTNLPYYLSTNCLVEDIETDKNYPVGILGESENKIRLYFQHYSSFQIAKLKWNQRKKRVNLNNLYVIMTDRDGATKNDLIDFDNLPYKNKIILTCKKYDYLKNQYVIRNCVENDHLGNIFKKNLLSGKSKLDTFNFIEFINRPN
ncbi:DUF1919 domain-containing protein [Limosilactobacillus oris]|uniref:DUF1919 domain-containing protein n=1 Tax=Limosilactobacillus oris TaxID=1632 RepID=UPI0018835ED3|nr:DUF1919 domain-containing protein [Limosilactobacillus oris]MBF0601914.1 DUF1919 domain-containing protein [Limosilactobacillus oris]